TKRGATLARACGLSSEGYGLILHAIKRSDDCLAHLSGPNSSTAVLRDIGGAVTLLQHQDRGAPGAGGRSGEIERIAQAHGEARDGGDRVGDAAPGDVGG